MTATILSGGRDSDNRRKWFLLRINWPQNTNPDDMAKIKIYILQAMCKQGIQEQGKNLKTMKHSWNTDNRLDT